MCSQLIGLMIEDVVEKVYHRLFGHHKFSTPVRVVGRVLGYVWVMTFLVWSGPVRWYPVIRMQAKETEMIRPSAFRTMYKAYENFP